MRWIVAMRSAAGAAGLTGIALQSACWALVGIDDLSPSAAADAQLAEAGSDGERGDSAVDVIAADGASDSARPTTVGITVATGPNDLRWVSFDGGKIFSASTGPAAPNFRFFAGAVGPKHIVLLSGSNTHAVSDFNSWARSDLACGSVLTYTSSVGFVARDNDKVCSSTDGYNWTSTATTTFPGSLQALVGIGATLGVSTFRSGAELGTWYSASFDGAKTWTPPAFLTPKYAPFGVAGNGRFIFSGGELTAVYQVGTRAIVSSSSTGHGQIAFGAGVFVDQRAATSADGVTWTAPAENRNFERVAFDGNVFVAFDGNRGVFSSSDGRRWTGTGASLPTADGLYGGLADRTVVGDR